MAQAAKSKRQNRTITVDFHNEAPHSHLLRNGKAFIEFAWFSYSRWASTATINHPVMAVES
jgi:hypothetical protein